jgi:aspartyl-tRNA(Asn)/glutamyl-tRNA(Gln) amidotransferase subunit A
VSDELAFLPIAEAAARIAARTLSPVELVDAVLARIDRHEPTIHAYISLDADQARAAARVAEAEVARGGIRGPLHGIPYGLKDVIHVAGRRTTANSRLRLDHVATADAEVHARLRDAGAILIGKLNTYEYGTGTGADLFELPFPPARNPWNTDCFTGGSSTGAGAAVAAGLAAFAIGIDTGGSVRLPAAACGVTGLKPTLGSVSAAGIMPNCPSLDHVGPLTRSARDADLVLQAIAGTRPAAFAPIAGVKIGAIRRWHAEVAPDAGPAFEAAISVLRDLDTRIVELAPPTPQRDFVACMRLINNPESLAAHREDFLNRRADMGPALFAKFMAGVCIPSDALERARSWRRQLSAVIDGLFTDCDVLASVTAPRAAPPIADGDAVAAYTSDAATMPFSLSGHPAVSVPMGFTAGGLPLGLQLAAPRRRDDLVLRVADAYQQAIGWHRRRPTCAPRPIGATHRPPPAPESTADRAQVLGMLAAAGVAAPAPRDIEVCSQQAARMATMIAKIPVEDTARS